MIKEFQICEKCKDSINLNDRFVVPTIKNDTQHVMPAILMKSRQQPYQSVLKASEYLVYADTETESLGGILSLNYTGIDNDSFLQGTSMEHFLEETIIHELLHCMFEKRECDSLNQHETNINIISNIIWQYAENPLFSIDHTGKIQA